MPRMLKVKSLSQICVQNVVNNIDTVWCKHYVDVFKEQGPYKYLIGPFNDLPSDLLIEILSVLKREKKLKRHYLDLLITPQLDILDLSKEQEDIGYPLDLAAVRCQRLKSLHLSYCQKIPRRVYQDILPVLTSLQTLSLNGTSCNDSTLFIIGAYLTKLKELDATGCSITDHGITVLCAGVDDLGRPSDRLGQCKELIKLCINYTKITDVGIQTALQNLPSLRIFECNNSIGAISNIYQKTQDCHSSNHPRYQLRNLTCLEPLDHNYESGNLPLALCLCPDVAKVDVQTHAGLTDNDFLSLTSVKFLRELLVLGSSSGSLSFDESLAPVLQIQGSNLRSLSLAELSDVNVQVIVQFCQNLDSLELIMNRSFNRYWPDNVPSSTKKNCLPLLRKLTVVCSTHLNALSDIPGESLRPLLSSPRLQHIFLKECQFFNDDLLTHVLVENSWSFLEHLEIEQCHEISEESIDTVLTACASLSTLKMWECRQLTRQNALRWSKLVKKNKWNITVDWA